MRLPCRIPGRCLIYSPSSLSLTSFGVTADDQNRLTDYKAQAQPRRSGGHSRRSRRVPYLPRNRLHRPSGRSTPRWRAPCSSSPKTNQFNLTTRRHSASEIEDFAADPGGLAVAVRVRDRFGDAGVVGPGTRPIPRIRPASSIPSSSPAASSVAVSSQPFSPISRSRHAIWGRPISSASSSPARKTPQPPASIPNMDSNLSQAQLVTH